MEDSTLRGYLSQNSNPYFFSHCKLTTMRLTSNSISYISFSLNMHPSQLSSVCIVYSKSWNSLGSWGRDVSEGHFWILLEICSLFMKEILRIENIGYFQGMGCEGGIVICMPKGKCIHNFISNFITFI